MREDIITLLDLVQAGKLKSVVDTVFPLAEAPQALRRIEDRQIVGKLVMRLAMRPAFERGRGIGQWHGGPVAALIDTVGDYALALRLCQRRPGREQR